MTPYWLLLAFPVVFTFLPIKNKKVAHFALLMMGSVYVVFIGFRHEVGADWYAYSSMFEYISRSSFERALTITEPGYAVLNWVVVQMGGRVYEVNCIIAIIFVSGLIRFAKKTPLPWLSLISITPYLVIAIAMSGARQATAIGLVFHLMASWRQGHVIKILLALAATSFHYSAIVTFIFVLQGLRMQSWIRWLIVVGGTIVSYDILIQTDQYFIYHERYIVGDVFSPGAIQHASLNFIPGIIYLLFIRRWDRNFGKSDLMRFLSILSIVSILWMPVSSTAADRLALYLSPIQMMVYSSLPIFISPLAVNLLAMCSPVSGNHASVYLTARPTTPPGVK